MNRSIYTAVLGLGLLMSAGIASASGPTLRNGDSIYGKPATAATAAGGIDVNTAKNLRVPCGKIVTFRNGEKTFSWKFDVAGHRPVNLNEIAPAGFSDKPFTVYVARNDLERS